MIVEPTKHVAAHVAFIMKLPSGMCTYTYAFTLTHTLLPDRRVRTKDGLTPVHIAAHNPPQGFGTGVMTGVPSDAESTNRQMIQLLLLYDGNSADEQRKMLTDRNVNAYDWMPLHIACSTGNEPAVQELIKHFQSMFTIAL